MGKNSASNIKTFCGKIKIAFPQKSEPNPTNISFNIYPIKILKKDKNNKGNAIFIGASCIFERIFLDWLGFFKKVSDITRKE